MVPIYSSQSWLALRYHKSAVYIEGVRDLYEACVIGFFFLYITELLGGKDKLLKILENKGGVCRHELACGLLPKWRYGQEFIYNIERGLGQFFIVKVITTLITFILELVDQNLYGEGDLKAFDKAYIWVSIIMNFSQAYALYCLVVFYLSIERELKSPKNWNPIGKFLCIKGVIFFTWWQGFFLNVLKAMKVFDRFEADWKADDIANAIQDYLICAEMLFFAVLHHFIYSYEEYLPSFASEESNNMMDQMIPPPSGTIQIV